MPAAEVAAPCPYIIPIESWASLSTTALPPPFEEEEVEGSFDNCFLYDLYVLSLHKACWSLNNC